jgi:transcriptional antiterminator Rof (Rho-off)
MEDNYKRVSCDLYDNLEAYATFKKTLEITYKTDEQADVKTVVMQIATLETKNKAEFLIGSTGLRLRLDKVLTIKEV